RDYHLNTIDSVTSMNECMQMIDGLSDFLAPHIEYFIRLLLDYPKPPPQELQGKGWKGKMPPYRINENLRKKLLAEFKVIKQNYFKPPKSQKTLSSTNATIFDMDLFAYGIIGIIAIIGLILILLYKSNRKENPL
ncbi:MAG: hypothetical protein RML49_08360, partial [Verrucomicrobiae bacterium]|nr:hypothetical protein [Verrucomicrobiae bacterium]